MDTAALLAGIRALTAHPTAPYQEFAARAALHQWLMALNLPPHTDDHGNTWVRLVRGRAQNPVAYVAHLDHPALQVEAVHGRKLRCTALGALPTRGVVGAPVVFGNARHGPRRGRITSAHVQHLGGHARLEAATVTLTQADTERPVTCGDVGVFDLPAYQRRGNTLRLRCADDLLGCAAIVAALSTLQTSPHDVDVTALFTRAEEVGLCGALGIAQSGALAPHTTVISVECSRADGAVRLGHGPVVRLGDRAGPFTPHSCQSVRAAAHSLGDAFVFQEAFMAGGACEATAFLAFNYACAGVALPLNNYHNQGEHGVAAEHIDLRDLVNMPPLLAAVAVRLGRGINDMGRLRDDMLLSSEVGRHKLRSP